ncbi:MAG: hypothetical protein FWD55_07150 [Propionibacteriaceae bacterium]|nr:hypothetical protein [Propionibacteriaceae bacterium]
MTRTPRGFARIGLALVLSLGLLIVSGCTDPNTDPSPTATETPVADWDTWVHDTATLFRNITQTPRQGTEPPEFVWNFELNVAYPYQTAALLNRLGPTAQSLMSDQDWQTTLGYLRQAIEDDSLIFDPGNAGGPAYAVWEMAWVDRLRNVFSDEEREALYVTSLLAEQVSDGTESDAIALDIYVTVMGMNMLGGVTNEILDKASAVLDTDEFDCAPQTDDGVFELLTVAASGVESRCSLDDIEAAWQAGVNRLTQITNGQDTVATAWELLFLEEARAQWWPDDKARSATIRTIFDRMVTSVTSMGSQGVSLLTTLHKVAYLLGTTAPVIDANDTIERLVNPVFPVSERLVGAPDLIFTLKAAATLGIELELTDDFMNSLTVMEKIAVAYGQGRVLDDEIESWLAELANQEELEPIDQFDLLDVVAPLLLVSTMNRACNSAGIQLIDQAVTAELDSYMRPVPIALAIRVIERCGYSVEPELRNAVAGQAESASIWDASRIKCAMTPNAVSVGQSIWPIMQPVVNPNGGAGSKWSASFNLTYVVLALVTTKTNDCVKTGILEARPA